MRYDSYRYLWPARPERAIPPAILQETEDKGWWAQPKLNGTNVTLYVPPWWQRKSSTLARGRHGDERLKWWHPGARWEAFVERLPTPSGWYVFQAELLHTKGTGRDTLYVYDLLVDDCDYLVGATLRERYQRLAALCGTPVDSRGKPWFEVSDGVWLAATFDWGFTALFDRLRSDQRIEGLVMKNPNAKLALCSRETSNSSWQVKCRYPKTNLSF
jgi:hypothetical protein